MFGSIPYLPPERLLKGVVDRYSDLWAVSVIIYQLVSGRLPFPGKTAEEMEGRILSGLPPERLSSSECSEQLERIVFKALAFEPSGRYSTVSALRSDLEALAAKRAVMAPPVVDRKAADGHETRSTADSRSSAKERQILNGKTKPQGKGWKRMALAALLLLFLAREGGAWWRTRELGLMLGKPLTTDETSHVLAHYRSVEKESFFGLGLNAIKAPLAQALVKAANRTTELTGSQQAAISLAEWTQADEFLKAAIELGVADARVEARHLVAEANVLREQLTQDLEKGDSEKARGPFLTAVRDLQEAARLDSAWFLPPLFLARLYELPPRALGWCTAEERRQALREAERRGYTVAPKEREQLLLGDLERAQTLHEGALQLKDNGAALQKLLEAERILMESIEQLSVSASTKPQDILLFNQELEAVRADLRNHGFGASLDLRRLEEH